MQYKSEKAYVEVFEISKDLKCLSKKVLTKSLGIILTREYSTIFFNTEKYS